MHVRRERQILEPWGDLIIWMAMGRDRRWAPAVHLNRLEIPLLGAYEGQEPGEVGTGQGRTPAGPSLFIGKEVAACRMEENEPKKPHYF